MTHTTHDDGREYIASLPCLYDTCAECPYVGDDGECSGDLPTDEGGEGIRSISAAAQGWLDTI